MAIAVVLYPEHTQAIVDAVAACESGVVDESRRIVAEYRGRSPMQGFHTWAIKLDDNWIGDYFSDWRQGGSR